MSKTVAPNQINVFVRLRLLTDADGTPATGVVAATAGHVMWFHRAGAAAVVTDSGSAADMGALDDAHVDWEFLETREGRYWCAFPDLAFADGVGDVDIGMSATGISCVIENVVIEPLIRFSGHASSVTSTTTTFPAGTKPLKGNQILVKAGTGVVGDVVLVTSATGEVATHAPFETGISATTSTIALIAGDAVTANGGINVDVAVSSRSTITPPQVNEECDTSISDALLAKAAQLPATTTPQGNVKSSLEEVAQEVEVQSGTGSPIIKTDV